MPYIAEAANGDTGQWVYDASDFSEHYNHSSFVDLVLTGLFGIKPQATDSVQLKPLVPDSWAYFAVQNVPYHGHLLTIMWDQTGTHYNAGTGLQVCQDGTRIYQASTVGNATVSVAAPVIPAAATPLDNLAANAWTADQDWFKGWDNRTYTATFPRSAPRTRTRPRTANAAAARQSPLRQRLRHPAQGHRRIHSLRRDARRPLDQRGISQRHRLPDRRLRTAAVDRRGQDLHLRRRSERASPQSFDVQYLSGTTWTSVPGQVKTPTAPVANAPNEVTFPTVATSQFRVVFTPSPASSSA